MKRRPLSSYRPPPILVLATLGYTFGPACHQQGYVVEFNDPPRPVEEPNIEVDPLFLELGPLDLEHCERIQAAITITNLGRTTLSLSDIELLGGDGELSLSTDGETQLEAGDYTERTITFEPEASGEYEGTVLVHSDDPDTPIEEVGVLAWTKGASSDTGR